MAAHIIRNPATALATLARAEMGVNPHELGGSAWVAATTSFAQFSLGAIVAVITFPFGSDKAPIGASVALGVLALFWTGAGITVITGRSALASGSRQVVFGVVAAAITSGIGRSIGSTVQGTITRWTTVRLNRFSTSSWTMERWCQHGRSRHRMLQHCSASTAH